MPNQGTINIVVVSNITLEPFFSAHLKDFFVKNGLNLKVSFVPYNEYLTDEHTCQFSKADQIIVWLNFDCFYPNFINDLISEKVTAEMIEEDIKNKSLDLYTTLKKKYHTAILWLGAEDYCYHQYTYTFGYSLLNNGLIDRVNITLNSMFDGDDKYLDLKSIIAKVGIAVALDNKNKYRWNTPYSRELLQEIASEAYKQFLIHNGITKKCIILDCDNVLWGGILSEDGIEGIQLGSSGLGRPYQDFQRFILNLYYHGVIIAICSKNDKSDVLRVFEEHDEMILKKEHIAYFCVNWNNKPTNIKNISETLDIGLNSIVFVDDSDFEIQSVKAFLPEVTVIKYSGYGSLEHFSCFNVKKDVDVERVQQRNRTYQTNELRKQLQNETLVLDEYIKALEIKVDIHEALAIELSRIAELTQRVNKCTNGKRYSVDVLKEKIASGYRLFSVSLSDRFSNLGLIGVIGIEGNTLDLFSVSCRALGRNVEEVMIHFLREINIQGMYYDLTVQNRELYSKLKNIISF